MTAEGASQATAGSQTRCHTLSDRADAVREARRFVQARLRSVGTDEEVVADAALVAAELLANAVQHGLPPIVVCVEPSSAAVRVEVHDASDRSPVRPAPSTTNMTGRGLTLVDSLASRWGIQRLTAGGKSVWCEFAARRDPHADIAAQGPDDLDTILEKWDDEPAAGDERFTVVLGDVPTDLLIAAKAHIDNVVREFSLAAAAGEAGDAVVPEHLARLIETVLHRFADARLAIKRQALAAALRGEVRTRLTLHLPLGAADAGEAYLAALDEADEYARAARLLTLETPADHRMFRHWYVEAVIKQLRQLAAGVVPDPVVTFEQRLVSEIRRLSAAERASTRSARLQRVTAGLARARTPQDVADVVVSVGVDTMSASGGALLVPAGDGEHLAVPGVVGYGEELIGALRDERIDAPLPAATALRTGEAVWLETQEERDRRFPILRGFEASTIAMCAVPLVVGDRMLGALRFSFNSPKLFDDDERSFVLALAALTAQTLQRTELYEAERRAALELQRALLPEFVRGLPGWDVAAYYSPAGGQEAGGDFYDVIPLPDGRIAAIVGDVMGRGVEAAAAMAQIRSTIRAYAIDDPEPSAVFSKCDVFFRTLELDQLVTALYILVDSDGDRVRIGSAGHLPPLLVSPGHSEAVPTAGGLPFGVVADVRDVTTLTVPSGAALVAITDGLVERRGEDIDEGIQRVLDATRDITVGGAQALLSHVVASATTDRTHDDDVTVLVLRRQ
jgi:serine phosphatase RsbU (regulator of sigma subunit)/anti-sigma regulatory factor (Ser/Thr protein kinase)